MGVLYGGLRACRCERPNVSPSLGTDKKFCWPVDASYLEAHHLLYFISPVDTKSWQDTYKKLLKQKKMKTKFAQEKSMICIPTCFLQQCWILWSIKALKWLSGSCGGFGTLAKAWFAWNMDRSLGARAQPAFLSIYLKLQNTTRTRVFKEKSFPMGALYLTLVFCDKEDRNFFILCLFALVFLDSFSWWWTVSSC